jgi:CheY-like chemotaxis protein
LLTNAVKFTSRGGRVQISLRRVDSSVQIEVLDNGAGIEPDFLPHVFERFSQADASRTRSRGGLGLGLSIVKHLIELHGGTVAAHSEGQGKGSLFAVRIPIVPVRSAIQRGENRTSLAPDVKYPAELQELKVLVLDDEQDAREVVQMILEQGGARVALASTVNEALEAVHTFRPDVVVSDIGMPEEDGYVFIEKLRAFPREQGGRTPAIALTAYARAEDRRRALVAGFQNHAAKPIEPQELVMVVANLARYR